ncbi:unnamed protein product [Calypogeia fissa]
MGRVETVDTSGLVNPGSRQELLKATKDAQIALKWMGSSPDRADVEVIGASPPRLPSQKADNGPRPRNSHQSLKPKEIASVRAKALQTSSREPLPEDAFELFKREFIEQLAEKAKERPGYLLANEDFAKPVKAQPKLVRGADEDFVKPVKARLKLKQTEDDFVKPGKPQLKLFERTESLEQPSSFAGLQNSKKEILERTVKIIESSRVLLRSSSLEKKKSSSPVHPCWMSKSDKLKLNQDKQSWSKDVEETSKEFILNKFFQSPTRRVPSSSVYDADIADEEVTTQVHSSRRRILSTASNATQQIKNARQQSPGQITLQSEKSREVQDFDSGNMLGDHGAQIRRNVSKHSTASPGRRSSSEDTRTDSSRSPGRKFSSEEKRNDSSGSSGRKSSSEEKRNDSSGSSGRRLSSEERKKDSTKSPVRRSTSEERRKEFSQISTKSVGTVSTAENLPARNQGTQSDSARTRNEGLDSEVPQESVKREKHAMLKSLKYLKMAAAVDQAHFLRALQDNGAVQSSAPLGNDMKRDSAVNDGGPQKPSSPNGRKNINNLQEVRRDFPNEARETRSREPSPGIRREVAFGGTIRVSREPSPTGRRDAVSLGSLSRSREPSPSRREVTSYGSSGSTVAGRTTSLRRSHSFDSLSEKSSSSLRSGEIQRNGSEERSPSSANSLSGGSPQLSRQSSIRSIETDENESVSGGSMIEKLMRKASLRNSSRLAESPTISSSVPASPKHRTLQSPSSDLKPVLRRTLSFADVDADTSEARSESTSRQSSRASSPTSSRTVRKNSIESNLQRSLSERKRSTARATSVSEQSATSAPVQQHPLNNSLRVNVQVTESTIAKLKSRSSSSPTVKTIEESCLPIATPERTASTTTPVGSPSSPGSDDSGSEGSGSSGIEQPSPVSVLSYNSRRTPFQEDSRLSPLEQKLQVLHERIRKSKTDVSNQKKARLEKIKDTEAQLNGCVVTELNTEALLRAESKTPKILKTPKVVKTPQAPQILSLPAPLDIEEKKRLAPKAASQQLSLPAPSDFVERKPLASPTPVLRDEKPEKVRPAAPISDFCTSLETLDLKSIVPWVEKNKWDLVYIRDVLLASNFGRDKSSVTKWYSVTEPMDPCLFEKLEEFYRFGKKFSGSHFLTKLAESQERYPNMQAYVQRVFFDPAARARGNVDTMNRCFIFDVVNDTLAKKLVPYVGMPRPWMKRLAKPVVRPRPTGSTLMQEIWTDIYDQIGNNGSMSMDKAQLHQSLEDLISQDLFKRTDLFPSREIERATERVGTELERRILDDLLEETITSIWKNFV